jgi:hypothetical protein
MIKRDGNRLILALDRDAEHGGYKEIKIKLNGEQVFRKEFTSPVAEVSAEVEVQFREDGNFVEVGAVTEKGEKHAVLSWNDLT